MQRTVLFNTLFAIAEVNITINMILLAFCHGNCWAGFIHIFVKHTRLSMDNKQKAVYLPRNDTPGPQVLIHGISVAVAALNRNSVGRIRHGVPQCSLPHVGLVVCCNRQYTAADYCTIYCLRKCD